MTRRVWLNPAASNYQARKWQQRAAYEREQRELDGRSTAPSTPDPMSDTESIRVDPEIAGVAFVVTSVTQPAGGTYLRLYPSSLVRADPVIPGVAYLTVTTYGP